MPKKTTILIIILAVITAILIFLAVRSDKIQEFSGNLDTTPSPTAITRIEPYATLYFSQPLLDLSKTNVATHSVDILIDTSGKPVFGAQLELQYDQRAISNVKITTPTDNDFFGVNPVVLINNVDAAYGRISYAVGLNANETEKSGKGIVATLSFTANNSGIGSSKLAFLPKTAVTTLQTPGSILKKTTDLPIIFISQPATSSGI